MKNIVVIFHGDCWDGFGGGYAAWKKFGNKAGYFGLKHGERLPRFKNKILYIVDFSFKEPIMKKLIADNEKVIALDHHVSAEKTTKMAHEYVYALNHSGAVIAWKYFHPKKPVPVLLRHIEDVDIWKWELPNTRAITANADIVGFDFKIWDKLVKDLENPAKRKKLIEIGKKIGEYENKMIKRLLEGAMTVRFEGYKTLVVNSPILHSEIGMRLVEKMPPIAIVWSEKRDQIRVSLRSNGKVDVTRLAAKYGGGGHKAASGFGLPVGKPFPWKRLGSNR